MLGRLQQQLREIYQTDSGYDVRDFLVTDACLAKTISGGDALMTSGEALFVLEDGDDLAVSLYLDDEILGRLDFDTPAAALLAGQLDDLCKVIEGLSHFDYIAWRATRDRCVSLLELELQAEIDKFVSTMHLARDEDDAELMSGLHDQLFEDVKFHDHLTAEQVERYRAANGYAARFCRGFREALIADDTETLLELRRFYRMPLADKVSYIHSRAWA